MDYKTWLYNATLWQPFEAVEKLGSCSVASSTFSESLDTVSKKVELAATLLRQRILDLSHIRKGLGMLRCLLDIMNYLEGSLQKRPGKRLPKSLLMRHEKKVRQIEVEHEFLCQIPNLFG